MSATAKTETLRIGGEPRADLLPPELRLQRKALKTRKRLWLGVLSLVVLMVLGTGLAALQAFAVQVNLASEQARTTALLLEQKRYIAVRAVQDDTNMVKAAQEVGTSTEIDWQKYLEAVQTTLPANVVLTSVNIEAGSPLQSYAQATVPLQGARVATLSFTATSPTLPQVPAWLDSLTGLPGYADASPGSVTRDESTGDYKVDITMHISDAAFTNRFAAKGK
jgi:cytoskeletal protein RodZ